MKDLSMVEGLPKPAFKGWDLTRGCWPRERGKEREARQGGSGRTAPRLAEDPAVPGSGGQGHTVRSPPGPAPCLAQGAAAPHAPRPRSSTSLPSLPPGTRPRGLPGPVALSPPPPFVSKAREQALKESGGGGGGKYLFSFRSSEGS